MSGEVARNGKLSESALVMEGVVPFLAVTWVLSPLQLSEEPLNGKPPVFLKWDEFAAPVVADGLDPEVGDAVDLNLLANFGRRETGTHAVGFGV